MLPPDSAPARCVDQGIDQGVPRAQCPVRSGTLPPADRDPRRSTEIYIAGLKELRAQIVAATKPVGAGPPMAS